MIYILSPSTTMNFEKEINTTLASIPVFQNDTNYLVSQLLKYNQEEFSDLMKLSNDLSSLNFDRYKSFVDSNIKGHALYSFTGEVFSNIDIDDFDTYDTSFANEHFLIMSGLYGVLTPFDLIKPYRLEMKIKLKNNLGNDLYKFWKDKITIFLLDKLEKDSEGVIINLASNEYVKCIDLKKINTKYKFIDIVFKEYNCEKDEYKVLGMHSKRARGLISNYIIKNKINTIDKLKCFNQGNYKYNELLSTENSLVFTR